MASLIDNLGPSLAINEFVALSGLFPSTFGLPGNGYMTVGMIRSFAGGFEPGSLGQADGQLLAINQNPALFSLLGNLYGGDGQTTFALPDLSLITPIGAGLGGGLTETHDLGVVSGSALIALSQAQMPPGLGGTSVAIGNEQPSLPITYLIRITGSLPDPDSGGANFIGQVVRFAGNLVPDGYLAAAGQTLSTTAYPDLFALIGTTFGGDGLTTFRLPDLRGRNAVGASGEDPLGSLVGTEVVTLDASLTPTNMGGGGQAFDNRGPGLALTYMVAVQGVFPSPGGLATPPPDQPLLGEIAIFAAGFAPRGWMVCDGRLLQINQNPALFSLLGNQYGGDGLTTFALPDFRGRTAVGATQEVPVGTVLGVADQVVTSADMPDLTITGTAGAERIYGGDGRDTLGGAGGADTLYGGLGNDTYVNPAGATIVDLSGSDTVQSGVTFSIAALFNVENVVLTGAANSNAAGNSAANRLTGNAGQNVLNGNAGADTMTGGAGNDTYYVDTAGDQTVESAGGGIDIVSSTVSRTLSVHVENLNLGGSGNIDGNGNTAANVINGNAGNNILRGYGGSDTLNGSGGQDILLGGTSTDYLAPGNDALRDIVRFSGVGDSTGSQRDIVTGMDLNGEDRLDFTVVPVSIGVQVNAGVLNLATINADLATAVNANLAAGGAVLFDPSAGDLNVAGHVFLVVDANGDGVYKPNQDYVVQLVNRTGALTLDDFI